MTSYNYKKCFVMSRSYIIRYPEVSGPTTLSSNKGGMTALALCVLRRQLEGQGLYKRGRGVESTVYWMFYYRKTYALICN